MTEPEKSVWPSFQSTVQGIIAAEWTHSCCGWELEIPATTDHAVGRTRSGCFCCVRAPLPQGPGMPVNHGSYLLSLLKSLVPSFPLQLSSLWCCHHKHHRAVVSSLLLLSSLTLCEFLPLNALFIRIRVEAVTANLSKRKDEEGQASASWCQPQE